jgi:hypothetical protein
MIRRLLFGPLVEPHHGHDHDHDHPAVPPVAWYEIAGLTPLMVLIVLIGVYPRPIFERISPPVRQIASRFYVEPETGGEPGGGGGGRGARPGGGGGGPGGRRPSQPTAKAPQAIAPTLALRSPTLD